MAFVKKKAVRVSGVILLLFMAIVLSFNSIVAKLLESKFNDFLLKEDLKHYHVQYERVGFNFLNRSVSLIGLKYVPDSSYLDSLDKADVDIMVPSVSVGRLSVSGIDFKEAIQHGLINIHRITLKKPEIKLYKFTGKFRPVTEIHKDKKMIRDSVKIVKINGINIQKFVFKKSKFEIYNYKQRKFTLVSQDITIRLKGLQFEKSGYGNHYFYPVLQSATLLAKNNKFKLGNNLYEINFGELFVDLKRKTILITGMHYRPLYSKKAFSRHIRFQKERFDMHAGKVVFSGIDFYQFLTKGKVFIHKILIADADIDLYRDKQVPFNHKQRPLFPHQLIKKLKSKLKIDTIAIRNARFEYNESSALTRRPLNVYFTGLSGTITHVTSIPYFWRKQLMRLTLTGKMMDSASMDINMVFPLASTSDTFYFSGGVYGPVPFSVFNPAIYPASGLKFTGGVLDQLVFRARANPHVASGSMTMLYHNLNFQATKKKDRHASNKFMSWGVNTFVRKNNPRKGEQKEPKSVTLYYKRDIEKGLGNFLWKTVFSGMKATMLPSVNTINRRNTLSVTPAKKEKKPRSIKH